MPRIYSFPAPIKPVSVSEEKLKSNRTFGLPTGNQLTLQPKRRAPFAPGLLLWAVAFLFLPSRLHAQSFLSFSSASENLILTQGSSGSFSVNVNANPGPVTANVVTTYGPGASGWLTFPASYNSAQVAKLTLAYQSTGLAVGIYSATVTTTATGYNPASLQVQLRVLAAGTLVPTVLAVTPPDGATNVDLTTDIATARMTLPPGGINNNTLAGNVRLFQVNGAVEVAVPGRVNGSAGGDVIVFNPDFVLNANTAYRFVITNGVQASNGTPFAPYQTTFTTGAGGGVGSPGNVEFVKVALPSTQNQQFTSLVMGPEGKLYGLLLNGEIRRFPVLADGTLGPPEVINTLRNAYLTGATPSGNRSAIGLVFAPGSTAGNLVAYVSHCSEGQGGGGPAFDGNVSRLTGSALQNHQLLLTRLPRSTRDHLVHSLAFGPDGALYFNQGSNTAAGLYDDAWLRDENLMSGALLRLDLSKLSGLTLPLNVETSQNLSVINSAPTNSLTTSDGKYNPYAANAPLTIYASGIRNAYDLVWHSNGQLYVPTNGTSAGGNSPASVAGTRRPDGRFYDGPAIPATLGIQTQNDYLYRVDPTLPIPGYFGHPNPLRGEFVLNRGYIDNPKYPVGTAVDARYRGAAFNFGEHKSPNGALEYRSNAFGGALKGKLLVCRFSGGDDIAILTPGANLDIDPATVRYGSDSPGVPGMSGFADPLDIVEDVNTGNLYVAEFDFYENSGQAKLTLLRATTPAPPAGVLALAPVRIVDNEVAGGPAGANHAVTIGNPGTGNLIINSITLAGTHADQYQLSGLPVTFPQTVLPGRALYFNVAFNPTSVGPRTASIRVGSSGNPVKEVMLSGLATGQGSSTEPSLQAILDAYGIGTNVGDEDKSTSVINGDGVKQRSNLMPGSDETNIQQFRKAGQNSVVIEPLAVFGTTNGGPMIGFGWYDSGEPASQHELFTVSGHPASNAKTVRVNSTGTLSFDPLEASFGFYTRWPVFNNRRVYGEKALNTFSGAIPHHVRVYPLKDGGGTVVPNAYVVAIEEQVASFDYQDLVVVVRNVQPATPVPTNCLASGSILREQWNGIDGNQLSAIPLNTPPASISQLTRLESPTNVGENFGARLRGYLCAPETGDYTFWIASDDHSRLYLSEDENPANKLPIAFLDRAVPVRAWTVAPIQQSRLIRLEARRQYYVEVVHKEGVIDDHLAVGWRTPSMADNSSPVIIPGSLLSPFVPATARRTMEIEKPAAEAVPGLSVQPNPFFDKAGVTFIVTQTGRVMLDLYDLRGRRVRPLYDGKATAGDPIDVEVEGKGLAAGMYFLRLRAGGKTIHGKLILSR